MPRTSQVELPGCPRFRAICCDSLGLIKVIEVEGQGGAPRVVARWGDPDPRQGVQCLSLSSGVPPTLAVARKTETVEICNPASGAVLSKLLVPHDPSDTAERRSREGSDGVCGLHLFRNDCLWGPAVMTCTEYGDAALQRVPNLGQGNEGPVAGPCTDEDQLIYKWNISRTGSVLCLSMDSGEVYAVFGGKGVDVNVWDMSKKAKLWSGKTPHRDNLGLISPAWVTAVTFLSKDDHSKVLVGTGHHQVRLYDIRAQRRPVLAFDYGESPIKAVEADPDGHSVFVGTGGGDLGSFDMRIGKLLGGFKGKCAGSIRSIVRHSALPIIASCGLDRYLRIHSTTTRQLLGSLFLKQQLVSVVFDAEENISTEARNLKSESSTFEEATEQAGEEVRTNGGMVRAQLPGKKMKVKRVTVDQNAERVEVKSEEDVSKVELSPPGKKPKLMRETVEQKGAEKVKVKKKKP